MRRLRGERGFDTIYFMTTNRCNLACEYCYETVRTGDATIDIGIKAIEWLGSQPNYKKYPGHWKHITFFGGEPLLMPVLIRQMLEYALKHTTSVRAFSVLTNGTLWNDEVERTLRYMMDNNKHNTLQISLDGGRESHDRYRKFLNGEGSFDVIVRNSKEFKKIVPNLSFRQTVCPENVHNLSEDFKLMCDLAGDGSNVSLTPIVEMDWNEDAINIYAKEIKKAIDIWGKLKKKVHFNLLDSMRERVCYEPYRKKRGCSAGQRLCAVTPDGDIYPCHRFAAYKNMVDTKIGDVYSGVDYENVVLKKIVDAFGSVDECNKCEAVVCNACMAANVAIGNGLDFRPPKGYCMTALSVHKIIRDKVEELLESNKIVLRYGEIFKKKDGGFFAMDNETNLEYVDDTDLFARSFVEIFKKLKDLKTDTTRIKKELGIQVGQEGVKSEDIAC